jgi:hypothetical protein
MEDFFAGHSHGPTPHLIDGCPLCEHLKTARNQAIEHLSEALHLLAGLRPETDRPTLRLNIAPIDLTADDTGRCHSIDLTAKQAEALSDAIDSMNAYAGSESPIDRDLRGIADAIAEVGEAGVAQRYAEFMARVERQNSESIGSGEWSAAAVAQNDTDLWDAVNAAYADLDPIEITDKVIRDREADLADVAQILDELYGDVPYPYAEEDVPLPHDQAQMDALTSEVETFLQDGGE